jgi:hypothetical protein
MYRSTGVLQYQTSITKQVGKGLTAAELGKALGIRHFELEKDYDDTIYFKGGTYDRTSGIATYTKREFPAVLDMFIKVHKLSNRNTLHLLAVVYAALLFFLAISSLLMYKPGTRLFRRGISLSAAGVVMAIILMFTCAA